MVTDRRRYADAGRDDAAACRALVAAVRRAAHAGVDLVQLRERDLDGGPLLALAEAVRDALAGTATRLVINDRLDVSLAARADGLHLPATAMPAWRARTLAPERFLIGRSVHSEAEAVEAERGGGCDYLIFGTVFASASKPPGHAVAGLDALARVCAAVHLPVLAIGGITLDRLDDVARAGAAGVAAIGLFLGEEQRRLGDSVRCIRAVMEATEAAEE